MTNEKAGVEVALYYNKLNTHRLPLKSSSICVLGFFTNICARACKSQSSAHYSQLFRQIDLLKVCFQLTSRRPYLSHFQNRLTCTHPNLLFHFRDMGIVVTIPIGFPANYNLVWNRCRSALQNNERQPSWLTKRPSPFLA